MYFNPFAFSSLLSAVDKYSNKGAPGNGPGIVTMICYDHVRLVIPIEIGCDGFAGVETDGGRSRPAMLLIPAVGSVAVSEPHLKGPALD